MKALDSLCRPLTLLFYMLFTVPLILSAYQPTTVVNVGVAVFQLFIVVFSLNYLKVECEVFFHDSRPAKILALCLVACVAAWLVSDPTILLRSRTWIYVSQAMFFLALVGYFKAKGEIVFSYLFYAKVASLLIAMCVVAVTLLDMPIEQKTGIVTNPPIYRNLRHMNYDMFYVVAMSMYFYISAPKYKSYLYLLLFTVAGYFSVWSIGRGEMVALSVFGAILLLSKQLKVTNISTFVPVFSFVAGAILVFALGEDYYIWHHGVANVSSANALSGGRIAVWNEGLTAFFESGKWFFGLGPEAYAIIGFDRGIIQAHNIFIQWLVEFGIVGTIGLFVAFGSVAVKSIKHLVRREAPSLLGFVCATYLATLCYGLVDGLFYHGLSLAMIIAMCAYIVAMTRQDSYDSMVGCSNAK